MPRHVLFLTLLLSAIGAAQAQPPAPNVDPLEGQRPPQPELMPPPALAPPRAEPDVRAEGQGAALNAVRISGSSLSADILLSTWQMRRGRPLTPALAREVAIDLNARYKESDIVLYAVSAPRQDLSDGVLDLTVVEAHVGAVTVSGDADGKHARRLAVITAPLTAQDPLRRPLLERRVSLARELPGVTVTPRLARKAGAPDQVEVQLETRHRAFETALSINTRGTPLLGRTQVKGELIANSLLLGGDRISAAVTSSSDLERYRHLGASYSAPLGSDGARAHVSAGRSNTQPQGSASEGEATQASVLVSYPLQLSFRKRVDVSASFDWLNSENAVLGVNVDSARTRVTRINLSRAAAGQNGAASVRASLSFGLDSFGARVNPLIAQADFAKLSIAASGHRKLSNTWGVKLVGAAQVSEDLLPGSELFSIGGDGFGRAFVNGVASGDQGVGLSSELAWKPPGRSEFYGFADRALAWRRSRGVLADERFALSSAGAGVRYRFEKDSVVGIEFARALDAPNVLTEDDVRFVVSLQMER